MSIFKDTFKKGVQDQIETRQVAITDRTPSGLQYYNSRNAWIRMTSAVDVGGDNGALAKKYILQGGLIDGTSGTLRSGLGDFSNAYSNVGSDGTSYRLGIRPMPGITGLEIEHKASYGSLRQATIKFQCWDIKQLEELELLYMRPGYSVMVEWGWAPYLNNDGNIGTSVQFIDDVLEGKKPKEEIWRKIYNKAIENGNYDAMYGFIKNYSWKTRPDGGYDCSTVIMSMGEIAESLKINYCAFNSDIGRKGIFGKVPTPFAPDSFGAKAYAQNIIAGIFSELYASYFAVPLDAPTSGAATPNTSPSTSTTTGTTTTSTAGSTTTTPTISQTTPAPTTPAAPTPIPTKAILMGDSLVPLLEANTKNVQPIGADGFKGPANAKWGTGWACNSFLKAINAQTVDNSITHVFISMGSNDTFIEINGASVSSVASALKSKYPSAKLYIIQGTYGAKSVRNGDGDYYNTIITDIDGRIKKYYPIWQTNGVTIVNNPPIFSTVHPGTSTPGIKTAAAAIDQILASEAGGVAAPGAPPAQPLTAEQISQIISGLPPEAQAELLGNPVPGFTKGNPQTITLDGEKYDIFGLALDVSSLPKQMKDTIFDEGVQAYITLEGIVKILNKYVLISDIENKLPIAEISLTEGEYSSTPGSPLLCLGDKFQLSTNPSVCLIKNQAWLHPDSLGFKDITFDGMVALKGIMESLDKDFWYEGDYNQKQLGVIKNIYVNLGYIYSLVTSEELEDQDRKEKKDISVFDFLKNLLSGINTAIGNVANLDVFIDPQDNKVRIIDVNYVDSQNREKVWNNAHILEIGNNKSIVRSYSFESSMMPEQITMIATAAQVEGGTLAENQNTLVDFNQKLIDRVIPKKKAPDNQKESTDPNAALKEKLQHLKESTSTLIGYFDQLTPGTFEGRGDFDLEKSAQYANALKDLINFWKGLTPDPNKNRAIIPTKLSVNIDGIGGIITGNIFRIPDSILPRGYKGEDGVGPTKLAYTVTNIGHSINNNDWMTNIQSQMILLDPPKGDNVNILNIAFELIKALPSQTGSLIDKLNNLSSAGAAGYQNLSADGSTGGPVGTVTNTGKVGASAYPGDVSFHQYGNAKIPVNLMKPIADGGLARYGGKYLLQPEAANQYLLMKAEAEKAGIKWRLTSAYRDLQHQASLGSGKTIAKVGSSPHGWGGAIDFGELYQLAGGSGSPSANANVRNTSPLYKWLAANGPKYNWFNPYRLADGTGTDECWHWEYWGPNVKP